VLVALLYRFLLSSSGEAKVEHRDDKVSGKDEQSPDTDTKVESPPQKDTHQQQKKKKQEKMAASKESDSNAAVPESVLGHMKDVTVLKKTATFNVGEQVSTINNQMLH